MTIGVVFFQQTSSSPLWMQSWSHFVNPGIWDFGISNPGIPVGLWNLSLH